MKVIFTCSLFVILSLTLNGQDVHLTNYRMAPMSFNPAMTGHFNGTYRIGAVYRDQFSSFFTRGYKSQMAYFDTPQAVGFTPNDWVGVGLHFYNDQAGDIGLNNVGILLSGAYHYAMDADYTQVFSFGMQYGIAQVKVNNPNAAKFGDEIKSGSTGGSQDLNLLQQINESFQDINIGAQYRYLIDKDHQFTLGGAVSRISLSRVTTGRFINKPYLRINAHASYQFPITDKFSLDPTIWYSRSVVFSNLMTQMNSHYKLGKKNILHTGIGYRWDDSVDFLVGLTYDTWTFSLAFDLTVSSAALYNNNNGAIELGVYKLINIYKRPVVKRKKFCDRV